MQIIKPYCCIIHQNEGLKGVLQAIETAGRNCYKSEHLITNKSYKKFSNMLKSKKHLSPFEHGTVYLKIEGTDMWNNEKDNHEFLCYNPYVKTNLVDNDYYITTNYRTIMENDAKSLLKYIAKPSVYHEKRIMVRIICDRGILAEFTRHRSHSFCVESTRYCNYSKDKFGNSLTFIEPLWLKNSSKISKLLFKGFLKISELTYFGLIKAGWTPQMARNVLPLATKCDMIMTGFLSDWKHFFDLRCSEAAHPQARELAEMIKQQFKDWDYVED